MFLPGEFHLLSGFVDMCFATVILCTVFELFITMCVSVQMQIVW